MNTIYAALAVSVALNVVFLIGFFRRHFVFYPKEQSVDIDSLAWKQRHECVDPDSV